MSASQMDFFIKYKDQDISLIAKIIEKVYNISLFDDKIFIINLNFFDSLKKEIGTRNLEKEIGY